MSMANVDGQCRWSKSLVNGEGQRQWVMWIVNVDGQSLCSMLMVKVYVQWGGENEEKNTNGKANKNAKPRGGE